MSEAAWEQTTSQSGKYIPVGDELEVLTHAWKARLPVLVQGPTGCGKTRFVESFAAEHSLDLTTVSCTEDLSAADLTGRFLLEGGDTVWHDGPLTRSVRSGGICYLDEVVEARTDASVVVHSLADHRRTLHIERLNETLEAGPQFMLVMSYNPGYQSILKELKPSTRQRFVVIDLGFPPPDVELNIVAQESGASPEVVRALVQLAGALRQLDNSEIAEAASPRTVVSAARLAAQGLPLRRAAHLAMAGTLTDDPALASQLRDVVDTYIP